MFELGEKWVGVCALCGPLGRPDERGPRFVLSVLIPCTTSWGRGMEFEVCPS